MLNGRFCGLNGGIFDSRVSSWKSRCSFFTVGGIMRLVFVLALVFLALTPTDAQERPAKLADLNDHGEFLTAEGVWRADNLNENTENAFPSVTRLECYKHGGKTLVGSDGYCMQASAQIVAGHPDIGVTYYPVMAWDRGCPADS
jgi:hypothetical protein